MNEARIKVLYDHLISGRAIESSEECSQLIELAPWEKKPENGKWKRVFRTVKVIE